AARPFRAHVPARPLREGGARADRAALGAHPRRGGRRRRGRADRRPRARNAAYRQPHPAPRTRRRRGAPPGSRHDRDRRGGARAARGRRGRARAVRPRPPALRRRALRRRPGGALDARGGARRGSRDDRGRLRAVSAPAGIPAADAPWPGGDRPGPRAPRGKSLFRNPVLRAILGAMSTEAAPRADAAAQSVGATDLFVLRRVGGNRFVHFGGAGRGAGWAGLVEVSTDDEASLRETLQSGRPVRLDHGGKELVFGPYYARAAAFVPVTNDVVVVFGGDGAALEEPSDDALHSAAMLAAESVGSVTPAKALADQLEELEAMRTALIAPAGNDVEETARALALCVAEALSCELAAVYLAEPERVVVAERGWSLKSSTEEIRAALASVLAHGRFPYCVQDAAVVKLPEPLDRERGIRSYYLLEL